MSAGGKVVVIGNLVLGSLVVLPEVPGDGDIIGAGGVDGDGGDEDVFEKLWKPNRCAVFCSGSKSGRSTSAGLFILAFE